MPTAINISDFLRDDFDCNQWLNERRREVIKAISAYTKDMYDVHDMLDTRYGWGNVVFFNLLITL